MGWWTQGQWNSRGGGGGRGGQQRNQTQQGGKAKGGKGRGPWLPCACENKGAWVYVDQIDKSPYCRFCGKAWQETQKEAQAAASGGTAGGAAPVPPKQLLDDPEARAILEFLHAQGASAASPLCAHISGALAAY